jgi:hypothetical protein
LSKGFHVACDDVEPSKTFVVYAGKDTFTMEGGIKAISLLDLMQEIIGQK